MEDLFKICGHMTKVNLPSFIEKFINNELPEDYQYDYFKENPEEVINYRSIFFNLNQAKVLATTMNKYKDKIFTNPKHNGLLFAPMRNIAQSFFLVKFSKIVATTAFQPLYSKFLTMNFC